MQKKKVAALTLATVVAISMQTLSVSAASFMPSTTGQVLVNRTIVPRWVSTTLTKV